MIKQMPELPNVTVYVERLAAVAVGQRLERLVINKPFVLRHCRAARSRSSKAGRSSASQRMGKRIVLALEQELYVVIHLMIAGRLRWRPKTEVTDSRRARAPGVEKRRRPAGPGAVSARLVLATFVFPTGTLYFTEAGTTRRASLHIVRGAAALAAFDRGGLEVLDASLVEFTERLQSENHTLKRALTDPQLFSGIGNAYSDEILHRAQLSPLALTSRLTPDDIERLQAATRGVLGEWIARLRAEAGSGFPETVTAFREGMAVHGRFRQPCPVCGAPVQRIRYAANETNYCARCQTGVVCWPIGRSLVCSSRTGRRSIDDIE